MPSTASFWCDTVREAGALACCPQPSVAPAAHGVFPLLPRTRGPGATCGAGRHQHLLVQGGPWQGDGNELLPCWGSWPWGWQEAGMEQCSSHRRGWHGPPPTRLRRATASPQGVGQGCSPASAQQLRPSWSSGCRQSPRSPPPGHSGRHLFPPSLPQKFGSFFQLESSNFLLTVLRNMADPRVSDTQLVANMLEAVLRESCSERIKVGSVQPDCPVRVPSGHRSPPPRVQGLAAPDGRPLRPAKSGGRGAVLGGSQGHGCAPARCLSRWRSS